MNFLEAQTINQKDIIVATNVTDNFTGRYNIGVEYFFGDKKKNTENSKYSIALNGGIISTENKGQSLKGFNLVFETNLYTDLFLPKKWNEYGGLKVNYGSIKNETLNQTKNSYFIGITTGAQPIILKKIALKLSSDIGYTKNGITSINAPLFNSSNEIFYSGFDIMFNVGLGFRF